MRTRTNKVKPSKRTEADVNRIKSHDQRSAERGGKFHHLEKSHRLPPYDRLGDMQQHVSTYATEFANIAMIAFGTYQ